MSIEATCGPGSNVDNGVGLLLFLKRNNPAKFTDLSGHKPCTRTSEGTCDPFEEMIIKRLLDEIENAAGKSVQDKDNDGYPETPDAHATPVKAQTISSTRTQSTYKVCILLQMEKSDGEG